MRRLLVMTVVVAAAMMASSAHAIRNYGYVSQATVEDAVYNSAWADKWGVDDVECEPVGRAVLDSSTTPATKTYKHFRCYFWSDFEGQFDQVGQVSITAGGHFLMYLVSGPGGIYTAGPVSGSTGP